MNEEYNVQRRIRNINEKYKHNKDFNNQENENNKGKRYERKVNHIEIETVVNKEHEEEKKEFLQGN